MKADVEKRAYARHRLSADIAFSYFNNAHSYNALTVNTGTGGICFKSNIFLQPGATIYVRLERIHPNCSGSGSCEGLHLVTLAEVKWCHETPDEESFPFVVGAKYFEPVF